MTKKNIEKQLLKISVDTIVNDSKSNQHTYELNLTIMLSPFFDKDTVADEQQFQKIYIH